MRELGRRLATGAVGGLVVGVVIALVAHATGHSVRPWLTCLLAVTAGLLLVAVYESAQRVLGAEPVMPFEPEAEVLIDRKRGGLDATVRMVERGMNDVDRFPALRARISRVVEERLRETHGVEVLLDPGRARELVGDRLVQLVVDPSSAPPPRRAELEQWLTRLERL